MYFILLYVIYDIYVIYVIYFIYVIYVKYVIYVICIKYITYVIYVIYAIYVKMLYVTRQDTTVNNSALAFDLRGPRPIVTRFQLNVY